MYVITNRRITDQKGLKAFGSTPNPRGPNELRLLEVTNTQGNKWDVKVINDRLTKATVNSLNDKFNLNIDVNEPWFASLRVACDLFQRARVENKSILIFVHGFNNDIRDVLVAAQEIERQHDVIVVPFTWPANGGGAVSGLLSYKSDKSDARASTGALNSAFGKIGFLHQLLTTARKKIIRERADKKFPNNPTAASSHFSKLMEKECAVSLNLLCHSMGNYLLKHSLASGDSTASRLIFDTINLIAADTNNARHAEWVGRLDARKRVNVVINENDSALRASRLKPGDEQLARLGHYTRQLDSPNAHYIDVTEADHVGNEHSYFKGDVVAQNEVLKQLFTDMFQGRPVEHGLEYRPDNNSYVLKQ